MNMDIDNSVVPFLLSYKLALWTTPLVLILALPVSALLTYRRFPGKQFLEILILTPMILPPSVLGFYILIFLAPESFLGDLINRVFGLRMVFSFPGLVIASAIYSFPIMMQGLRTGMEKVSVSCIESSYMLQKGKLETFFFVILPLMKNAVLSSVILSFTRVFGEFGVAMMVGGNIQGKTKLASIALYEAVESLEYTKAHIYAGVLLLLCFLVLYVINKLREVDNV